MKQIILPSLWPHIIVERRLLGLENTASEPKVAPQNGPFLVMGRTRSIALFLGFGEDAFPVTVLQPLLWCLSSIQHLSSPVICILFEKRILWVPLTNSQWERRGNFPCINYYKFLQISLLFFYLLFLLTWKVLPFLLLLKYTPIFPIF